VAILKTSLEEDLLSKQERYVLRNIQHVAQLAEGLKALKNVKETIEPGYNPDTQNRVPLTDIEGYLTKRISVALASVRIPNAQNVEDTKSPLPEKC